MAHYQYLIVGGGMTAASAIRGIREIDADGSIGLIGHETERPYDRPPLTKALWKGKSIDKIWRTFAENNVELHLGRSVTSIDVAGKCVVDDQNVSTTFDTLLLATGGTPRRLPFGGDDIMYYRTLADYRRLREMSGPGKRVGVIGGGFIGSELAAGLAMVGTDVVMAFPETDIGSRAYPAGLASYISGYFRDKGVTVLCGSQVVNVDRVGSQLQIHVSDHNGGGEQTLAVDAVVAGIGILPNVSLAEKAGIAVDNGIVVDEHLMTSAENIYAAGDVASFMNTTLGRRMRVEHEDNAKSMGKMAGRIMAGSGESYDYLPFFYSDLFDLGYEAIGEVDTRLDMVEDWKEPNREGVIYYLRDGRVRGVLLWNVWDQVPAARQLIAEAGPFDAQSLKGRLPEAKN